MSKVSGLFTTVIKNNVQIILNKPIKKNSVFLGELHYNMIIGTTIISTVSGIGIQSIKHDTNANTIVKTGLTYGIYGLLISYYSPVLIPLYILGYTKPPGANNFV